MINSRSLCDQDPPSSGRWTLQGQLCSLQSMPTFHEPGWSAVLTKRPAFENIKETPLSLAKPQGPINIQGYSSFRWRRRACYAGELACSSPTWTCWGLWGTQCATGRRRRCAASPPPPPCPNWPGRNRCWSARRTPAAGSPPQASHGQTRRDASHCQPDQTVAISCWTRTRTVLNANLLIPWGSVGWPSLLAGKIWIKSKSNISSQKLQFQITVSSKEGVE